MTARPLATGKLPTALLGRLLASLPAAPAEVLLGPALGEDACAIEMPAGVLIAAADPITLTGADVGRYGVIVNANDVAVTGAAPRWFLATLLLPPTTTDEDVERLFSGLRDALAQVGAVLVGGHSEVTDAVRTPVVCGAMLGIAPGGQFVTTSGARPGDVVVQVGAVPVEGAAVLATEARGRLASVTETVLFAASRALDEPGISIVDAALLATDLGASAMHDPTEGGLASGLHELAVASGCLVRVDRRRVRWFEPGRVVCAALGADSWATLASGCLLATFPQPVADVAVARLAERFDTTVLGRLETGRGVYDETDSEIAWPKRDEVARILEQ
jgi:hydrogenase expression/formation protein HypE